MTCSKEIVGHITNKLRVYLLAVKVLICQPRYQVHVCVPLKYQPDEPTNRGKSGVIFFSKNLNWNLFKKQKLFISVFAANGDTWFYPQASRNKAVKM